MSSLSMSMPPMMMPMYFTTHWQHQHVLFSFWEIKTVPGGLARPIGAGAVSGSELPLLSPPGIVALSLPYRFGRSFLELIRIVLSLWVMLVAMTYDVGLFVAIAVGGAVGHFIFSKPSADEKRTRPCRCGV
ncbi:Copper transport protein [Plasmodiophora brassicae]